MCLYLLTTALQNQVVYAWKSYDFKVAAMTPCIKRISYQHSKKKGQILAEFWYIDTYVRPEWFYAIFVFVKKNIQDGSHDSHDWPFPYHILVQTGQIVLWCTYPVYVVHTLIGNQIWLLLQPSGVGWSWEIVTKPKLIDKVFLPSTSLKGLIPTF